MHRKRGGASREISLVKLGGLIHRQLKGETTAYCAYCEAEIEFIENEPEHSGTVDHVYTEDAPQLAAARIPFNDPRNLVCACKSCNSTKGEGTDEEWTHLKTRIESLGTSWAEMEQRVKRILRTHIDDSWGKYFAETLYPQRRAYLLQSSRMRHLRKRHGDDAEQKAAELDAKRNERNTREDDDEAPF